MNRFSYGLMVCSLGAGFLLSSCVNESPWQSGTKGEGIINLNLAAHNDVTAAVPAVRAVSGEVIPPPVEEFKIRISKLDGSYSQTFSNAEEFGKNESFPVGNYEIEAWYGNPGSQGFVKDGEKGYEHAYYYGKTTDVVVQEAKTTEVSLQGALANSIVVIEYTDAFKNYFKDWSTIVQTDGNEAINLGGAEGTSYVVSGNVSITIDAELQNGKRVKLNPGGFEMLPQHKYLLRYTIYNGEVGHSQLAIEFDESLNEEPILVDLSEDLELTPVPVITPEGFEHEDHYVNQSGTPYEGDIKFNVVAKGGIKEAFLTIISKTYQPSFLTDGKVDLCKAPKEELEKEGIKAIGFSESASEYGQLDLSELCRKLPDGTHTFTLQVNDKYTQASDPIEVTMACQPVNMSIAVEPAPFGEGYADLTISYDGPDPTIEGYNPFSFSTENNSGSFSDSNIISILKKESSRADYESFDYIYRISVPEINNKDEFKVSWYFNDEKAGKDVTVPFQYPDYTVLIDPMSKKLRIKVDTDDPKKETLFFHKLTVFVNGVRLYDKDTNKFLRDEPTDQLIVYNLKPETSYTIQTTLYSDENSNGFRFGTTHENITTSAASPVPNGDFSQTAITIDETIQVGGQFKAGAFDYTIKCPFKYSEPTGGWASVNQKTFYKDANPKNSWFTVASTYKENNYVVVRTVGYSHSGKVPGKTGDFFNTTYYCENSPDDKDLEKCSGELFLGNYSYDGTENRTYGIPFEARPTSFSFNYTYSPDHESSRASVEIEILAKDKSRLAYRKVYLDEEKKEMTNKTITFPRYPFGKEAGFLKLRFLSSDLEDGEEIGIYVPTKSALKEGASLTHLTINENSAHAIAIGSVLTVSNLRFDYGERQDQVK